MGDAADDHLDFLIDQYINEQIDPFEDDELYFSYSPKRQRDEIINYTKWNFKNEF